MVDVSQTHPRLKLCQKLKSLLPACASESAFAINHVSFKLLRSENCTRWSARVMISSSTRDSSDDSLPVDLMSCVELQYVILLFMYLSNFDLIGPWPTFDCCLRGINKLNMCIPCSAQTCLENASCSTWAWLELESSRDDLSQTWHTKHPASLSSAWSGSLTGRGGVGKKWTRDSGDVGAVAAIKQCSAALVGVDGLGSDANHKKSGWWYAGRWWN